MNTWIVGGRKAWLSSGDSRQSNAWLQRRAKPGSDGRDFSFIVGSSPACTKQQEKHHRSGCFQQAHGEDLLKGVGRTKIRRGIGLIE